MGNGAGNGDGRRPCVGLVLPGGGARGAYQIGVLKAIAEIAPGARNPFPVLSGISVGAINAAALGCACRDFQAGVRWLSDLWAGLRCHDIYRTDFGTLVRSSVAWFLALTLGGLGPANPRSFLDTGPLAGLLERELDFSRLAAAIEEGALRGLAVTASSYATGRAVTFFQGADSTLEWERMRRDGQRAGLAVDHLMASSAMPFIFPPWRIGREYFGDGALRLAAPLSPAIHMGAERLLVIGVRDIGRDRPPPASAPVRHPTMGDLGGYVLDILTSDNLDADVERATRINETVSLLGPEQRSRTALRPIDIKVIRPSRDLREVTARHLDEMPAMLAILMRGLGASASRARLASFLMFEPPYLRELMELGYRDGLARRDELAGFLALDA
ncbi:MAG: patatin-like phospholipase family protein, partial [Alphaproteobacteria bacterium]